MNNNNEKENIEIFIAISGFIGIKKENDKIAKLYILSRAKLTFLL